VVQVLLLFHILSAILIGPILALPLLTRTPVVVVILKFLRIGAIGLLVTGAWLWASLQLGHPAWLIVAVTAYVVLCIVIGAVLEPAAVRMETQPDFHARLLVWSWVSCALTLSIIVLMVLRPGEA
jgi:hypothetical protein